MTRLNLRLHMMILIKIKLCGLYILAHVLDLQGSQLLRHRSIPMHLPSISCFSSRNNTYLRVGLASMLDQLFLRSEKSFDILWLDIQFLKYRNYEDSKFANTSYKEGVDKQESNKPQCRSENEIDEKTDPSSKMLSVFFSVALLLNIRLLNTNNQNSPSPLHPLSE